MTLELTYDDIVTKETIIVEIIDVKNNSTNSNEYDVSYKITNENGDIVEETINVTIDDSSENNDNDVNADNSSNSDKLPSTGGYANLTYLMGAMSLVGGFFSIGKKRK